jgi:hypothetical protein
MRPHDEKEGETPFAPASPPAHKQDPSEAKLPVKQIKLTPEGVNQADIDAVLKRLAQMRKRLRADILFVGGRLAHMRDKRIPYGSWTSFVERTFPLSVKTANIWIRAWEGRDSELAVNDWDGYMRALYGNAPKKLRAPASRENTETDGEPVDDYSQSGGEVRLQAIFPEKGEVSMLSFKNLVTVLEGEFFGSKDITLEAKEAFITELISWLENRRKNLRA